ncbi:hypothetical protein LTR91_011579 [Friedmanniomyces endolithicus]|uniref:GED domain-containing protein n=1 Tax=Friedmanniomyces endolithicus TaxID=329885 RepID=A0AAN6KGT3_9PEZI|nr:hypothetical protein LTR35_007638 [Friedmanniomyces endolithicus]KAK0295224.1 hypothetical protein LTS00_006282 [Friedmanniomyces endolithicus]KAK0915924.1 hypothetical protein LTR57_013243 [Friedmanniomyces endolithicus]KAK0963145.1 hypothetical protein LTS01_019469 [Friedmanniomyces endolithicus]KAK0982331.1 hypothetical protein LTR91_011579 [Friedmanniomyces endolithicus]
MKQEPMSEHHYITSAARHAMQEGIPNRLSRPLSISSRATPGPDFHNASSGNTTIADGDMEMSGIAASRGGSNLTVEHEIATAAVDPEDAMQVLGQDSRQLIRAVLKLKELNIDATLPSLPTFVVVGDQSAGKSSIIEAVCDISVPRDQGTCTRCPFQITTSSASQDEWICTVTLHNTHAYNPTSARVGKNATDYDRWTKQQKMDILDFAVVRDKSDLQDVLRRAQLAILDPHQPAQDFLHGDPHANTKVGFSPNTVSLEIVGPGLPELSFVDLPGAINVHEDGEDYLVAFVEKLIKTYLRDPKTMVLLACSADQDVENSTAFRYVSQCKALPRCLGVLTKPDLVGLSRHSLLQRILRGDAFKLRDHHAWFVTKQLTQEDLDAGATRREARDLEDRFFAGEPWATTLTRYSPRFGTAKLQAAISFELSQHIRREIPDLAARVQARIDIVSTELEGFPELAKSASHTVTMESLALVQAVQGHLRGDGLNNGFRNDYRTLLYALRSELKSRRLVVKLGTPGYVMQSICLESDDEGDADDATPMQSPDETPSKKRKANDGGRAGRTPQATKTFASRTPGSGRVDKRTKAVVEQEKLVLDLDRLSEMYTSGSIYGLPGQFNPKVTEDIIARSQVSWEAVVRETLESIKDLLLKMLVQVHGGSLANRRRTLLYAAAAEAIETYFAALWDQGHERILQSLACEKHKPITYNTSMGPKIDEVKYKLRYDRLSARISEHNDTLEAKGAKIKNPASDTDRLKQRADLEGKLKTDEYGRFIGAVASALAYYDVASDHLVDSVAKQLEYGLLSAIDQGLDETLRTALRATNEGYCAHLLEQDTAVEAHRVRLQGEKGRLNAALVELNGLGQAVRQQGRGSSVQV